MLQQTMTILGKITEVPKADAQRLEALVVICDQVLARGPVQADGSYRLNLSRAAASEKSAFGLALVVAPAGAGEHIEHLTDLVRVPLKTEDVLKAERNYHVADIAVSEETLKKLLRLCPPYCISGRFVGPDQCAAPGAQVTVYTVVHTATGYVKTPRVTVTTGPDGTFTACFPWCTCLFCYPCWPCYPIWWECWPWWWEWDILRVIEALEQRLSGPAATLANQIALIRPDAKALARGQGFSRATADFAPDPQRTALIKSKFANAQIRRIFPWWWWCCDDPNIVFSVTQNGVTVLDEDPAIDTRWCFEDGSSVTLVGNDQTDTVCNPNCPPPHGFVWTNVGALNVANIDHNTGYAEIPTDIGTDDQDLAFQGNLYLYGVYDPAAFSYYQVNAANWGGNPARGATRPPAGSGSPVASPLTRYIYVYDAALNFVGSFPVQLGPFNQSGLVNLYATIEARQNLPAPGGLPAFPSFPNTYHIYWGSPGLMLEASSSVLTSGVAMTGVDLTLVGYDNTFALASVAPDDPLTLTIDNTPLTSAAVLGITAFTASGQIPTVAGDCPAYDIGPGGYVQITVDVHDNNGHLFEYYVDAEYGHGSGGAVTPPGTRGYKTNPYPGGADPNYAQNSWVGGPEVMTYYPPVDCCYEFRIRAGKRVTDGSNFPTLADYDFQTINLKVSS